MSEPLAVNRTPVDPFSFEDPRFAGVDTAVRREDLPVADDDGWEDPGFQATQRVPASNQFFKDLSDIADETPEVQEVLDAEVLAATPPPPAPAVATVVVPDQPEVIEYDDGSSVTIEKTAKGWSATLDSNTSSGVEIFRGKTKDEMWRNLAAGKINATRKINSLNRQIKLGQPEVSQTQPAAPKVRELTADEVFELKTQLQNNPDLAFQSWFQKKTGKTVEQLTTLAEKGEEANENLRQEYEAKSFRAEYPEYFNTDENYQSLLAWLRKHKNLDKDILQFNAKNLGEAFEDLSSDGLLDEAPKVAPVRRASAPQPTPVAATPVPDVVPAPAPAPAPDPRIVGTTKRRVRGNFGIPQSAITNAQPVAETAPTDEELDNLSNDEINQLFSGVRRLRAQSARR
jgi:hypothetical protein